MPNWPSSPPLGTQRNSPYNRPSAIIKGSISNDFAEPRLKQEAFHHRDGGQDVTRAEKRLSYLPVRPLWIPRGRNRPHSPAQCWGDPQPAIIYRDSWKFTSPLACYRRVMIMSTSMRGQGIRLITYAGFAVLCALCYSCSAIIEGLSLASSFLVAARRYSIYNGRVDCRVRGTCSRYCFDVAEL